MELKLRRADAYKFETWRWAILVGNAINFALAIWFDHRLVILAYLATIAVLLILYSYGYLKLRRDINHCEEKGHPGWNYVGTEEGNPRPQYKYCSRCGEREEVDD